MMKPFEILYLCLSPFLPYLPKRIRWDLRNIVKKIKLHGGNHPVILDVGGRKSPYTIGLGADIMISDLPRDSELQSKLNLGVTDQIIDQTFARRSNISRILLDDMICSQLPDNSFDCVVSVEVLEHVKEDKLFVEQVYRVLKPNGVFLMTTPNGDFVKNRNPDHVRHYKRSELYSLLSERFDNVSIEYAVKAGTYYDLGSKSWSIGRPIQTLQSLIGNIINSIQSNNESIKYQSIHTLHLIASGEKPPDMFQ